MKYTMLVTILILGIALGFTVLRLLDAEQHISILEEHVARLMESLALHIRIDTQTSETIKEILAGYHGNIVNLYDLVDALSRNLGTLTDNVLYLHGIDQ